MTTSSSPMLARGRRRSSSAGAMISSHCAMRRRTAPGLTHRSTSISAAAPSSSSRLVGDGPAGRHGRELRVQQPAAELARVAALAVVAAGPRFVERSLLRLRALGARRPSSVRRSDPTRARCPPSPRASAPANHVPDRAARRSGVCGSRPWKVCALVGRMGGAEAAWSEGAPDCAPAKGSDDVAAPLVTAGKVAAAGRSVAMAMACG